MTQPIIHDQQAIRLELFAAINFGIDYGLPVPKEISFSVGTPYLRLDSAADLCGWADWLGYTETIPATHGQPHPDLADPAKSDCWTTSVHFAWRGTWIHLGATDPITPEQAQHWIDSGAAALQAALRAEIRAGIPVHYLEPGSDGDDDDRMACGQRFGDAVKDGAYTGAPADVTCPGCRKSAIECDYVPSFGEPGYPGCPGCGKTVVGHADGCTEDAS